MVEHQSLEMMKSIMELSIEMETISTEMIKPSTPTPPHLKSYKLSLIDQLLSFSEYGTPLTFFYPAPRCCYNDEGISIVTRLKESLSKTLALYYPLAGRVIPQESITDCNDEGVPFVVARTNCTLISFLSAPNRVDLLPWFIPKDNIFLDPTRIKVDGLIMAAFKITVFKCGGFAVGSHVITKAIDGTTWAQFFMTWSTIVKGGSPKLCEIGGPNLTIQTRIFPPVPNGYVPPMTGMPPVLQPVANVSDGSHGCIVKAFEFSSASISMLQDMARSDSIPNPTRIESVTCFLWMHFLAAAATVQSFSSMIARQERVPTTSVMHSVNIRPHLRPMLQPTTFGKFVTHAFANLTSEKGGTPTLGDLVVSLRQALSESKDSEWLNKFQGEGRVEEAFQHKKTLEEYLPKSYFFTSLKGFEQVNFGSGTPVWIGLMGGRTVSYFLNQIPMIHTSSHGIEAWPILDEKEMAVLESDQEFLTFAIPSHVVVPFTFFPKASL